MDAYLLECEDASGLGGPMGTEHTTHVFSKPFLTLETAMEHAQTHHQKYRKDKLNWKRDKNSWYVDGSTHIYTITKHKMEK